MKRIIPIIPTLLPSNMVMCGFTTRLGGVSLPPFDTLNLGYETGDDQSVVKENHTILYRFLNIDESDVAVMEQVHGTRIGVIDSGGVSPATDGLITSSPNIMLGVKCADCIPLLLFDPAHKVAGVVHCGWRTLVNGIAEKAVNIMAAYRGTVPNDVIAAMGPSAGACCYEIGMDVARHLHPKSVNARNGQLFTDLRTELTYRLMILGLRSRNIEIIPDCTICNEHLYFSYRRNGMKSGRIMGYIMIKSKI